MFKAVEKHDLPRHRDSTSSPVPAWWWQVSGTIDQVRSKVNLYIWLCHLRLAFAVYQQFL